MKWSEPLNCWICGKHADTGEHKIKKSLLTYIYGKGPYKGDNSLSHFRKDENGRDFLKELQGPNAKQIKFPKNICSQCNNVKTQPFDFAYDAFYKYLIENKSIIDDGFIDFEKVFGSNWRFEQENLYKYFLKLLGCDLDAHHLPVPDDIVNCINGIGDYRLEVEFSINLDKYLFDPYFKGLIGTGDLSYLSKDIYSNDKNSYKWSIFFSYINIDLWFDWPRYSKNNFSFRIGNKSVDLFCFSPLDNEQRIEVYKKIYGGCS
ncbi:hypothetical protein [Oceanospirillum sp.]|uniref:hypothetical protein n=1 Tax=Oceanospirillum sp. TaxID=2021254 RepID=UPI003A93EB51